VARIDNTGRGPGASQRLIAAARIATCVSAHQINTRPPPRIPVPLPAFDRASSQVFHALARRRDIFGL